MANPSIFSIELTQFWAKCEFRGGSHTGINDNMMLMMKMIMMIMMIYQIILGTPKSEEGWEFVGSNISGLSSVAGYPLFAFDWFPQVLVRYAFFRLFFFAKLEKKIIEFSAKKHQKRVKNSYFMSIFLIFSPTQHQFFLT